MKCNLFKLFVLTLLVATVGCASNSMRDRRVVVMDFQNTIPATKPAPYSKTLADTMTAELVNYPRVAVIERQDLNAVMDEAADEPVRWYEIGREIKADYVVVGSITQFNNNYVINVRLLSVDTGQLVNGSSLTRSCRRDEDIYPVMQTLSRQMAFHLKTLAERYDQLAQGKPFEQ